MSLKGRCQLFLDQVHPGVPGRIIRQGANASEVNHVAAGPFAALTERTLPDAADFKFQAATGTFHCRPSSGEKPGFSQKPGFGSFYLLAYSRGGGLLV